MKISSNTLPSSDFLLAQLFQLKKLMENSCEFIFAKDIQFNRFSRFSCDFSHITLKTFFHDDNTLRVRSIIASRDSVWSHLNGCTFRLMFRMTFTSSDNPTRAWRRMKMCKQFSSNSQSAKLFPKTKIIRMQFPEPMMFSLAHHWLRSRLLCSSTNEENHLASKYGSKIRHTTKGEKQWKAFSLLRL